MKKLKQIIAQLTTATDMPANELNNLLWQFICYSPKMPVRLYQEQLLNEAEKFSLVVPDDYFAKKDLVFNGFKWGNGSRKILITHGWGSKAGDFTDIITALKTIDDVQIIAFDAPGNGSSEGELSNLLLFVLSVKAIIEKYGEPDVLIGHSLGAMANIIAVKEMALKPELLISLTPLVRLKENFEDSMRAVGIPQAAQVDFLKDFEHKFGKPASYFNLKDWHVFGKPLNHWLAYDKNDRISTFNYMEDFLNSNPTVRHENYADAGHDRIIKSEQLIADLVNEVRAVV
ncbi:alpha/beta fold hydrolase [Mucilaginibacter sp.]|uniref:alpha/beta fold hydrolase n=1 Tax=Mucilaginibacter sp. TaxID=1882438 RepID=UPI003D0F28F0